MPSLVTHFGIEAVSFDGQLLVLKMPVTEVVKQPLGYLHGGATVALCETAASYGSSLLINEDEIPLGLEINANHFTSVQNGEVFARAEIIHQGRSTHVWEIKVVDEKEQLISVSRCTIAIKKRR
ncbi:PaaI family thioesterase [Macrococcoides caseolyticum]|uniref:PaaI family thioesterase n=1 Tax=Macrococcoides caseolyticum TaxID=69966 RepID=UPI002D7F23A1|nr:PaaI family thioesterase [Macrococcus caseolyticus]MCE4955778.1 PaaI family thioesterase [Macrococcus caseolyticus]